MGTTGKQHHCPAALIGQFGEPTTERRARRRRVWVARRGGGEVFRTTAEKIGVSPKDPRPYDLHGPGLRQTAIDDLWSKQEKLIPLTVESMRVEASGKVMPVQAFLLGLVPLVAQLMVRHPNFADEYRGRTVLAKAADRTKNRVDPRIPLLSRDLTRDDVNLARNIDYLCLCGILSTQCAWLRLTTDTPLVSSDLGFMATTVESHDGHRTGYAVPLAPDIAAFVSRGVAPRMSSGHMQPIARLPLSHVQTDALNNATAEWAPTVVFGRDKGEVISASTAWSDQAISTLSRRVPGHLMGARTEFEFSDIEGWFRLLHHQQSEAEPFHQHQSFEKCPGCTYQIAWVREVWPDAPTR